MRYVVPKSIISDRGKEFMADLMTEICKMIGIEKLNSTAFHHQTLGQVENRHKNLGEFLRIYCSDKQKQWSEWIPYWKFGYNTTVHTSTRYSPYELIFGRDCRLPSSIEIGDNIEEFEFESVSYDDYCNEFNYRLKLAYKDVENNLDRCKLVRKQNYDKNVNIKTYDVNDLILIRNNIGNKITPLYEGPYRVVNDKNSNVEIEKKNRIVVVHKNRTKLFVQ